MSWFLLVKPMTVSALIELKGTLKKEPKNVWLLFSLSIIAFLYVLFLFVEVGGNTSAIKTPQCEHGVPTKMVQVKKEGVNKVMLK